MTAYYQGRARQVAALIREGKTRREIAGMFGVTYTAVSQWLERGCPEFMVDGPHAWKKQPDPPSGWDPSDPNAPRPAWSYPDQITLRIVREIKAEMQREARRLS